MHIISAYVNTSLSLSSICLVSATACSGKRHFSKQSNISDKSLFITFLPVCSFFFSLSLSLFWIASYGIYAILIAMITLKCFGFNFRLVSLWLRMLNANVIETYVLFFSSFFFFFLHPLLLRCGTMRMLNNNRKRYLNVGGGVGDDSSR